MATGTLVATRFSTPPIAPSASPASTGTALKPPPPVPGGLGLQDYRTIIQTVHRSGYNTIRIPFSNQMVESPTIPTEIKFTDHTGGPINADLKGLNSLQILDKIIAYAGEQGLKVILDNHRSEAGDGTGLSGLWFTQGYPESAWIADWQMLAHRYANNSTVLGMDLRNEPHNAAANGACWGCGGANDWRLAAERAGNAVLTINPHLLIFVEGVDSYENDFYWWGGNLEGVRISPVRLAVANQLVYSAHDYGPIESGQPWFTPTMTDASLNAVWTKHWGYISQDNIAPVWLGEFGVVTTSAGNPTPAEAMEVKWFQSLVQFLHNDIPHRLDLLGAQRQRPLRPAQRQLRRHQRLRPPERARHHSVPPRHRPRQSRPLHCDRCPARSPAPSLHPAAAAGKQATGETDCQITYTNSKDWKTGFSAALIIRNTGRPHQRMAAHLDLGRHTKDRPTLERPLYPEWPRHHRHERDLEPRHPPGRRAHRNRLQRFLLRPEPRPHQVLPQRNPLQITPPPPDQNEADPVWTQGNISLIPYVFETTPRRIIILVFFDI